MFQRLSDVTPPQHIHTHMHKQIMAQTDYGPRLMEEHADNRGAGINNEIRDVRGLWVGGGITAPGPTLTNTIPRQTANEQNKAALRGLEG